MWSFFRFRPEWILRRPPKLQSKTALFWDMLCTETFRRNDSFSPYGNSCHLVKHYSETSICIYYITGGCFLEGSNIHIHHTTSHTRTVPCASVRTCEFHISFRSLIPVSQLFHKPAAYCIITCTIVSCNTSQGFCFFCSPCFPSQVYLKCSFFYS